MAKFGYIYLRQHESYDLYNVYKLGKTLNIVERDAQYATGEFKRGKFIKIYQMNVDVIDECEKQLQCEFKQYNIVSDGGTEFFDKVIDKLIIPYFNKQNIEYKIVDFDDIGRICKLRFANKTFLPIIPLSHQHEILNIITNFYTNNDKGKLIWPCGLGKTLLGIFCAKKLDEFKRLIKSVLSILYVGCNLLSRHNLYNSAFLNLL